MVIRDRPPQNCRTPHFVLSSHARPFLVPSQPITNMVNFGSIIVAEAHPGWDYVNYEALKAELEAAQKSNQSPANFSSLLQRELEKGTIDSDRWPCSLRLPMDRIFIWCVMQLTSSTKAWRSTSRTNWTSCSKICWTGPTLHCPMTKAISLMRCCRKWCAPECLR